MFEEVQVFFENNPSFDSDFRPSQHVESVSDENGRDVTSLAKELEVRLSQYNLNQTKNAELEEKIN